MNESLRDTLVRKLDRLPDETARQLLDYIEFLESKYHRSVRERSTFEKIADGIEDTLSASRLSRAAVKGTAQVLDAAGNVMRGVAAAGQAVVEEFQGDRDEAEEEREPTPAGEPTAEAADQPVEETGDEEARLTED